MNHLPFTLLAYTLNSFAVTVDKFLLTRAIPNPLIYVFYISSISLVVLLLIPFAPLPTLAVLILASVYILLWMMGAYSMYKALQVGHLSRVIPVIGTLIPLTLLGNALLNQTLTQNQNWAVVMLILGLILLILPDWKGKIQAQELIFAILSAIFFAISYLVLRSAYLQASFLTVFVWSRPILALVVVTILLVPKLRSQVLNPGGAPKIKYFSRVGLLFLLGQLAGGSSELLLTFSVSLADPALVNSLQGSQYLILFILALILSKKFPRVFQERYSKFNLVFKFLGILTIALGLYILAMVKLNPQVNFGVTYSPRYAQSIGLDPQKTYLEILDELKVKNLRLPVYWDLVETQASKFDFSQIDFYLAQAQKRGVEVILVLGYKQPRWPECFLPGWIDNIPPSNRRARLLNLIASEVKYLRRYQNIKIWQVENEPFLHFFGSCKKEYQVDFDFLKEEITLVKSLDSRPVLVTDSGELSLWFDSLGLSDIFGTTLYRKVQSSIFGLVSYPLPPLHYQLKDTLVRGLLNHPGKSIISELQAEPWAINPRPVTDEPITTQLKLMSTKDLSGNVNYAKEVGFSEVYLWGVEWWYWMKYHGHPEYVQEAKEIFGQ